MPFMFVIKEIIDFLKHSPWHVGSRTFYDEEEKTQMFLIQIK